MGQKAKKITEEQYRHAEKMAFAKSIDGLPKKVEKWIDESVLKYSRYLFTHRENGVRYGHCTHCHAESPLELGRTYTDQDAININRRHKEIGFCPVCRSKVEFRDSGRSRKNMIDREYILFATPTKGGGVLVRAGLVWRDYAIDYKSVKTNFAEEYRVYYNTGVDVAWRKEYSYTSNGYVKVWGRMTTIPNPTSKQPYYTSEKNYIYNHYYCFDDATFKNTNMRYAQISAYMDSTDYMEPCGWLDTYVKYPVLTEKLVKEGFLKLAVNTPATNYVVNRRAKTVSAALGLDKKELRELKRKDRDGVLYARRAKKYGITQAQAAKFAYDERMLEEIEKRMPLKKAIKYVEKQDEMLYTLADYWRDCKKLKLDLKREDILLPPDLAQAHQRTIVALAEARRQKELEKTREAQEAFAGRLKKLEKEFCFESAGLFIRPAKSHEELINEGSALHHCVASYAKKHLAGDTVILFIRRKDDPDKPFYTLEYDPKTKSIVQCRGLHNCGKTPEVEAFVEAWSGYIRNKKKKSHAAA